MSRVLPARVPHNLHVSSSLNSMIKSAAFLHLTAQVPPAPAPEAPEKRMKESFEGRRIVEKKYVGL